jgi:hypothetical protein
MAKLIDAILGTFEASWPNSIYAGSVALRALKEDGHIYRNWEDYDRIEMILAIISPDRNAINDLSYDEASRLIQLIKGIK